MRNWAAEHEAGRWSFLSEPPEQGRLALVAALARMYGEGTVIDVGCARGELRHWLDPRVFHRYVGVDITAAAFRGAGPSDIVSEWIEAGIESYEPPPIPGAVIVFSEVLYYLERPERELVRLSQALKANCALVSITVPGTRHPEYRDRVAAIWEAIGRLTWRMAADLTLADERGGERWRIAALVPL
ncbi:class I SAM-dependent methyltransferase [Bradyrhizobium sp. HKCCYLS3013]|uniref:class I SAM-dependent methyltransferase n=1 Tax=Bradyrhizobium sp. HKCCYLS3013 TaxID=3420735 RepID=UPI003EBC48D6